MGTSSRTPGPVVNAGPGSGKTGPCATLNSVDCDPARELDGLDREAAVFLAGVQVHRADVSPAVLLFRLMGPLVSGTSQTITPKPAIP